MSTAPRFTFYIAPLPHLKEELLAKYEEEASKGMGHASGFNLFYNGLSTQVGDYATAKCPLGIVGQMVENETGIPYPWELFPRSSITKSARRLANGVGLFDRDYTGQVICVLDHLDPEEHWTVGLGAVGTSLVQAVAVDRMPFAVEMSTVEELQARALKFFGEDSRGAGGFGSTGNTVVERS